MLAYLTATVAVSAPRLSVPRWTPVAGPTLLVQGEPGWAFVLESSIDLKDWHPVSAGIATNGLLEFLPANAVTADARFCRARQASAAALVPLGPQVDTNRSAGALITQREGGSCSLTSEDGVRFTFRVGPGNVLEPVAVAMRLVTNFIAFPAHGGLRQAVVFEPAGYRLSGAGLLEISYPTNLPALEMSSYAFASDGSEFRPVPDLVTSNTVVIPLTHFSGTGTSRWRAAERAQLYDFYVRDTLDLPTSDIATKLGQSRQRQLLGVDSVDCGPGTSLDLSNLQNLPCLLPWNGWITYHEEGEKTATQSSVTSDITRTGTKKSEVPLVVVAARLVDQNPEDQYESWDLVVEGELSAQINMSERTAIHGLCGDDVTTVKYLGPELG